MGFWTDRRDGINQTAEVDEDDNTIVIQSGKDTVITSNEEGTGGIVIQSGRDTYVNGKRVVRS